MRALGLVSVLGLFSIFAGCGGSDDSTTPPATGASGSAGAAGTAGASGAGGSACDDMAALKEKEKESEADTSCALACPKACDEADKPWECGSLAPWGSLPHACACGGFDGTHPKPVAGQCKASDPSGDAIAKTSKDVLPDGRRLTPAGKEWVFADDLYGTFPFSALRVPGTTFVVVSDDGYGEHALRVLDTAKIGSGATPEVSREKFPPPQSLNAGLALGSDGTLYAASGKEESRIRAFDVDKTTGKLTANTKKDVLVTDASNKGTFPFGIAVSPDGKRLVVGQVKDPEIHVYSLETANYGQRLDIIDLGNQGREGINVTFDPASSDLVYVSIWTSDAIAEVTLSTRGVRRIVTGKHPEEIVFLDANFLAVADALADDIAIVDRAKGMTVANVSLVGPSGLHGAGPSAIAYDASFSRLYATLSGENAVAVLDVDHSMGLGIAPKLSLLGRIPTGWWPTDVVVAGAKDPDPGALTIITGKGRGTGPVSEKINLPGGGLIGEKMHGSVYQLASPQMADITTMNADWQKGNDLSKLSGLPTVDCPSGAPYDFPIPKTNTEGPSKQIDRIVFVVRENKTFDAVMGDLPGVDGNPGLVMAPGKMDDVWPNFRKAAQAFTHSDNFYEDAEQSIQGHYWTAFGRSSDYLERTWLSTWGRGSRGPIPTQGVAKDTWPIEGGVFDWLQRNKVTWDNMGEQLANIGSDTNYGMSGFVSTSTVQPDTTLACYLGVRSRVMCDLKQFTYAWFPNDHTFGGAAKKPNPGLMIAVNDEATGMLLDALSHAPAWKSTLLVVVEDDPQDGSDHVDAHRTVVLLASPWVKRGYVSHTHFDIPSLHKIFAHVYGIPYNNDTVANAVLPYDVFTSTPDYTPYEYVKRKWKDLSCNASGTAMAKAAEDWDFSEPDEQPGLGFQVYEMLHGAGAKGK